jgi:uncharacterized protein
MSKSFTQTVYAAFRWFLPRTKDFVALFAAQSREIERGAVAIEALLAAGSDAAARDGAFKRVRDAESTADDVARSIHVAVDQTFMTPFDRPSIRALAHSFDTVIDHIEDAAQRIMLYGVVDFPAPTRAMVRHLKDAAVEIVRLAPLLAAIPEQHERIKDSCARLREIESAADATYRDAIAALLGAYRQPGESGLEFLLRKEIVDYLEEAADACQRLANQVSDVVLEQV